MKVFEIYDLTTTEILADNLTFDDVPELFGAYEDFYPDHEIVVCCRINNYSKRYKCSLNDFKSEWYVLIDELCRLGNIY